MITVQRIIDLDIATLVALLDESRAEGFHFVERLAMRWLDVPAI